MVLFKKHFKGNRKYSYIILILSVALLCLYYLQSPIKSKSGITVVELEYKITANLKRLLINLFIQQNHSDHSDDTYWVHNSKCNILSVDPFNKEILPYYSPIKYKTCSNKTVLTYVTKHNNITTLHINQTTIKEYSNNGLYCCYKGVASSLNSKSWDLSEVTGCKIFGNYTQFEEDLIMVTCKNNYTETIYKNVHAAVTVNGAIKDKMQKFSNTKHTEHLSVLIVGIDSVSRLQMIRSLPKTYSYLEEGKWIEFQGYNKIGDNTFPNVMGLLTGMNDSRAFKICNPRVTGQLDKCSLIWKDYRRLGFITGYAEDESDISTFYYQKKGFEKNPTDYYFRPYILATEKNLESLILHGVKYCTGPESAGERILNVARDFTFTFKNYPNFGYFWMNSFSHNEFNSVSGMDTKIHDFLVHINQSGIMNNTIIFFLSDHGFRFGTLTYTHTGWLEDRLPFFYMSVPKWFQKKFPRRYNNLVLNSNRLITPYDLYMTLQEILVLSGKNYSLKSSSACPKCKSIFTLAKSERSCEDAGIEKHWCTCQGYFPVSSSEDVVAQAAKFILNEVNKIVIDADANFRCVQYKLKNIISASMTEDCDINNKSHIYFLITLETHPQAVFQGTVSIAIDFPVFKMEGSISRLDYYAPNSWCVDDSVIKKYCYCHGNFEYVSIVISSISKRIMQFLF